MSRTAVRSGPDDSTSSSTDFFAVQESLANQVVRALSIDLSAEQRERLARRDTVDPEAWQLYLNGRYHWNRKTEDGLLQLLEFYEAAARRDPAFALPHAGIADALAVQGVFDLRPPRRCSRVADFEAQRAVELDRRARRGPLVARPHRGAVRPQLARG